MKKVNCPKCNISNDADGNFCKSCGTKLTKPGYENNHITGPRLPDAGKLDSSGKIISAIQNIGCKFKSQPTDIKVTIILFVMFIVIVMPAILFISFTPSYSGQKDAARNDASANNASTYSSSQINSGAQNNNNNRSSNKADTSEADYYIKILQSGTFRIVTSNTTQPYDLEIYVKDGMAASNDYYVLASIVREVAPGDGYLYYIFDGTTYSGRQTHAVERVRATDTDISRMPGYFDDLVYRDSGVNEFFGVDCKYYEYGNNKGETILFYFYNGNLKGVRWINAYGEIENHERFRIDQNIPADAFDIPYDMVGKGGFDSSQIPFFP